MSSKYVVGIDLGTTHSALAFAKEDEKPECLPIRQVIAKGSVEGRSLLPSFVYFAHESDGSIALPWEKNRTFAVGEYARARSLDAPQRVISSAKSWLCHPGVDRRSGLLPLASADDIEKISPVEASWRVLEHIFEAFAVDVAKGNAKEGLDHQDVVLTVPASFDAAARDLTVEAAKAAGIENLTLLEEPQAALYAWLSAKGDAWRKEIKVGDIILVIDVGGGTTDFSAIVAEESGGSLELRRIAVGDHILLGGDNMDLALAHLLKAKIEAEGKELDAWQMQSLIHASRGAKERILSGEASEMPIAVASRGSKLMGGTLRTELTGDEVTSILVEGFFPRCKKDEAPATRPRTGLMQVGLPFAQDPAVTKHLAAFLTRQASAHASKGDMLRPTCVLFNGGVMKSDALRNRVIETLNSWFSGAAVRVLSGTDMDHAVAKGAAAYALARRGKGIRIRGGTARAYYVGIEGAAPAVPGVPPPLSLMCVAPFGMEEGSSSDLPKMELGVVVGEPVRFRFFGSSVRREDKVGTSLSKWKGDIEELVPIEITLPATGRREGDVVPVTLRASITEVGTLALEAVPTKALRKGESWKIELNVRGSEE